jgi:hypothetical protein
MQTIIENLTKIKKESQTIISLKLEKRNQIIKEI